MPNIMLRRQHGKIFYLIMRTRCKAASRRQNAENTLGAKLFDSTLYCSNIRAQLIAFLDIFDHDRRQASSRDRLKARLLVDAWPDYVRRGRSLLA
jgi:hypothetical protein